MLGLFLYHNVIYKFSKHVKVTNASIVACVREFLGHNIIMDVYKRKISLIVLDSLM
jgi:hypothetical protein